MRIYNTLTRKKEEFHPIEEGKVRMYSCGPTVYNYFHLGNARPFIIFDSMRRFLEYMGYDVTFVQNFTDVDDKLINKAREEGVTVPEIAEKYIKEYFVDAKALGIKEASVHPRATENIENIIELVETLIQKGYAYEVDGDVYYRTKKFKDYGKLSHFPLDELEMGARISVGEKKEDPMDFALWKAQKTEDEIAWDSPWGKGRPGWHIECSAMANRYLGKTIDIHSGGKDLVFPHHENEIAQSEAANGCTFANYWMHNGFINVDGEKMSKSLGNFFTVRDIADKYDYEVIRLFMLSAHYRSPINFSEEPMEHAKHGLERLYNCVEKLRFLAENANGNDDPNPLLDEMQEFKKKFIAAMEDDLNTADAVSVLYEIAKAANTAAAKNPTKEAMKGALSMLLELADVLGLLQKNTQEESDAEIDAMIEKRQVARKNKDWATADAIRDELKSRGIILEDTPQGVKWRKE